MNAIEQSPAPNALAHLTRVPIAQLSPDLEKLAEKSFLATVALVWPYSYSTKSVSLLLAEPDFRLRGAKGQIKVTFHGRVAEKVAESHVGIGDTVCLALKDAKFVSNESVQKTPGRSVAWDAHFENGVSLEIYQSSQPPLTISVEPQVAAPHETEIAPPATPSGKSINPELDLPSSARPWGSPIFLKSTRTSFGGTIRSDFDPFTEEDGFVPGKGRKKPRYSLHREDWRVINEPESPPEQEAPMDWEQALNQSIDQELDEADLASEPSHDPTMDAAQAPTYTEDVPQEPVPVFAKPSLEFSGSILERHADESNVLSREQVDNLETSFHLPTDTPQIRPIPSPGLPIPSPLISSHGDSTSYFLPWTTPTQSQEIRSVPTEMDTLAIPAASSTDVRDTNAIDPIHAEIAEPTYPDVETIQQEHVFDAGFAFRDDSASPPGSEGLPGKDQVEILDSSESIVESHVVEADVAVNSTGDEAQMSNEAEHGHAFVDPNLSRDHPASISAPEGELDESPDIVDESAAAQVDAGTEDATDEAQKSDTTDDERIIDLSYLWRDDSAASSRPEERAEDELLESSQEVDGSDLGQADLAIETASNNVGSPQTPDRSHEEDSEREPQSVNYPEPTSAFDQDAINALERMITARDEEVERKRDREEEKEMEDDIDSSPSQGYGEENDEMVKDQEVYYAESVENYDSQDECEEDDHFPCDPRLAKDDFSVIGSRDETSEQEQNLPPQTGNHEVIVLDSDSDDEPASNYPVAPASQSTEREDLSHCFESGHPAVSPAAADFATGVQEYPEPWYVGGDGGYHGAVEEGSDIDEREESEESEESEEGEQREYNQQDDRVHESDMDDDESTQDHYDTDHPSEVASPKPEQDEDEEMEDAELIEEADTDENHDVTKLGAEKSEERENNQEDDRVHESYMDDDESSQGHYETDHSSEVGSPKPAQDEDKEMEDAELIEEADNDEFYAAAELGAETEVPVDRVSDDGQSGNTDPNLLDMPKSHHQGPPSVVKSPAGHYLTGDGQSDLHIPSSAGNMADFLLRDEPTVEGPEPLGGRVSAPIRPPSERQLLTPEPTQENASTREPAHDLEPDTSSTIEENEAPTSLDKTSQPDQGDGLRADPAKSTRQEPHVDGHDGAMPTSELAEAAEPPATPEPRRSLEVVISTESPKTPTAPVSRPSIPDRNASGLRSKLSYFAPLATLIDHYNALVDTISIVHEASPISRAKSGSKDWFMTIQLTDPSMAGTTLRAQIFRRYKASMPSLAEGNAVLLRDFKVRSLDHTVMLVSVDSSAWAVFDGSGPDAETNGPPVEYDSQERAYASGLRRWYVEVGSDRVADHMLQAAIERDSEERDMTPSSQVPSESGSPDSKRGSQRKRKSNRRVTIHELRDGTRYTEVGSPNSGNSSVHELRDGTLYANI
ncbi:Telomere end binding protein [Penicillium expansum]|nr:Telomere end binding protein [Penicillium expansum]